MEGNVSNGSEAYDGQSNIERIFTATAYSVIFPISLVANFLAIFIVYKKRYTRSVTNILFVNMFVANLLVTFVVMPYTIAYVFSANRWIGGTLGSFTCKLVHFAYALPVAASIFALLLSAIDRFFAVIYPFKQLRVIRNGKVSTTIIWISSFVCMSPYLYMFTTALDIDGHFYCTIDWTPIDTLSALRTFYIIIFCLLYAIPLLFMTVLYVCIGIKLSKRKIPGNVLLNAKRAADRARKKVVKMLVIVVVVFALSWLPAHITHLILYFNSDLYLKIPSVFPVFSYWLCHANSAISPCLILCLSEKFRTGLCAIFNGSSKKSLRRSYPMTFLSQNDSLSLAGSRRSNATLYNTTQI